MREEIPTRILVNQIKSNNHGVNSLGIEPGAGGVEEAQTLVFLSHEAVNPINDNYSVVPTQLHPNLSRLDPKLSQLNQTVKSLVLNSVKTQNPRQTLADPEYNMAASCLDVVSHVPIVTLCGLPQKKGLSPGQKVKRIKFVKGESCVDRCVSAQIVPNIPNVPEELSVGGRLQKFWQVWLRLGANPQVVSILRQGYSLPFKIRPPLSRFPLIVSNYFKPKEKQVSARGIALISAKRRCRKGSSQVFPSILQPAFLGSKTKWRPILDLNGDLF